MSDQDTTTEQTTETADESTVDETASEDVTTGEEALGDAGKQALDRMKEKWQAERDKRKAAEAKLTEKPADKDTSEQDAIRAEADRAAQTKANQRILRSEVKAAAAGKLADPADAYKFLDLDTFEVDADGNVDEDEIAEAIESLLKTKPYLGAVQDGKRFRGGGDGGTRKESRPAQLSRSDLDTMTPQQINEARRAGRLDNLL